ncbi:hypothetical protein BT63DRAFT_412489 [Microthyrium microscopicum]|uniref:Eisosome protein 1 n=1 Tax=Microthyrium microscopicum TaxID=703497 RepID=A0A6A6UJ10_9PEZI|nr:hypothetical protein BT63DRAFT_412489 [Microthyrium microscopicum]
MSNFAATAAHLANSNRKQTSPKEPDLTPSSSARSAAAHAKPKSTNATPTQSTPSTLGTASSRAALLAHSTRAQPHNASVPAPVTKSEGPTSQEKALLAATKSFKNQQPSHNKPVSASGQRDANIAQKRIEARRQESEKRGSRIINIAPEMLTQHPPIRMEREEKAHKEKLHSDAVALAKQAFAKQQQSRDRPLTAPSSGSRSLAGTDSRHNAIQYLSLQETAQRMAADRLQKIEDDNPKSMQSYYGYAPVQRSKSQRLIRKALPRGRTPSESQDVADSHRIRSQMTSLQAQINQVDESRQEQDRQRLLAFAQNKVRGDMQKIDEMVFKDTGKMSPAMMSDWDSKARARIREKRVLEKTQPDDAIDVGGGKLLDRSEIDELAAARVKPTLAGIDERVGQRRAEDEANRIAHEEKKEHAAQEKQRKRDEKLHKKEARKLERASGTHQNDNDTHESTNDDEEIPEDDHQDSRWKRLSGLHTPLNIRRKLHRQNKEHDTSDDDNSSAKKAGVWKRLSHAKAPSSVEDEPSPKSPKRFSGLMKLGRKSASSPASSPIPSPALSAQHEAAFYSASSLSPESPPLTNANAPKTEASNPNVIKLDAPKTETPHSKFKTAVAKLLVQSNPDTNGSASEADKSFEPPTRPVISAPLPDSLEVHHMGSELPSPAPGTSVSSINAAGDEELRERERIDKLAGIHQASKFKEEM